MVEHTDIEGTRAPVSLFTQAPIHQLNERYRSVGKQKDVSSLMSRALAGFIGTIPMTIFMLLMHRLLPNWQKYALPPEAITHELSERIDLDKYMNKQQLLAATLVSHFGYGTVMGMLYGMMMYRLSLSTMVKGILWGLAVWAVSYLGLLPALGISQSAEKEPWKRIALMIGAHVIWGASLGAIERQTQR